MNSVIAHLKTADVSTSSTQRLCEPPLDMFGVDEVERWITEKEVDGLVAFINQFTVS